MTRLRWLTACLTFIAWQPGFAEVQFVSDNGFIVENRIQVSQTPLVAWQVFVEQVDQWWPKDHTWWGEEGRLTITASAGGCFCEESAGRSAEHMHVSFVDPGSLLRMTGGLGPLQGMGMYGALDWLFTANTSGTEITLTYRVQGFNAEGFTDLAPIVDSVQALQLGALGDQLSAAPQ